MNFNKSSLSALTVAILAVHSDWIAANPTGGTVVTGTATITEGTTTTINQSSGFADITWDTFDVGVGESVVFNQPGVNSITLNRILDQNPSQILGSITANGQIFLSNPNGLYFSPTSTVNTAGLIATTSQLSYDDGTGVLTFADDGTSTGTVDSQGNITISNSGYLGIFSQEVTSSGDITATGGSVTLSDNTIGTLTLPGTGVTFELGSMSKRAITNQLELSGTVSTSALKIDATQVLISGDQIGDIIDELIQTPDGLTADDLILDHGSNDVTISTAASSGHSLQSTDVGTLLEGSNVSIQANNINMDAMLSFNYASGYSLAFQGTSVNLSGSQVGDLVNELRQFTVTYNIDTLLLDFAANDVTLNSSTSTGNTLRASDISDLLDSTDVTIEAQNITVDSIINYNNVTNSALTLDAVDVVDINQNIFGNTLDLTLDGSLVDAETIFQIGGFQYLGSLTVTGTEARFNGDIRTNGDLNLLSTTTTIDSTQATMVVGSISGDTQIVGSLLSGDANQSVEFEGTNLTLNGSISGFDVVTFANANFYLNGTVSSSSFIDGDAGVNIYLTGDSTLESSSINLSNSSFASYSADGLGQYRLDLNGTDSVDSAIRLENMAINADIASNANLNTLGNLNLNAVNGLNVFISGDFNANNVDLGSDAILMTGDTSFTNLDSLDFVGASLSGGFRFEATGKSGSTASLGKVGSSTTFIDSIAITGFNEINLTDNIRASDAGIHLSATQITADSVNTSSEITLGTQGAGELRVEGNLVGANDTDFNVLVDSGNVYLDSVSGFNDIAFQRNLSNEGNVFLNGDLSAIGDISMADVGTVTLLNNAMTFSASNVDLSGTTITSSDTSAGTVTINASASAAIENLQSGNINVNAPTTSLSGNLVAADRITLLNGVTPMQVLLTNDVSMTGTLNFLEGDITQQATIDGEHLLTLNTGSQDITLYGLGQNEALSGFILNGSGNLTVLENGLPSIQSSQGITFMGGLNWDIGGGITVDTSTYNGDINFADVTINGAGPLTLDAGSGNISLGSIGESSAITELTIMDGGILSLYGNILLTGSANGYDFSNVSAVQLYTDVTFGSEAEHVNVNFGNADLDGTYSLTLYSDAVTLGEVGRNVALEDITIISAGDLVFNEAINLVGDFNLTANSFTLNNQITSTGANVNITTVADIFMADSFVNDLGEPSVPAIISENGDVTLISETGNISISYIEAASLVDIDARVGGIINSVDDYITSSNPTTNIKAANVELNGTAFIGDSIDSPIVLEINPDGDITVNSTGDIFIANLNSANINSLSSQFIDTTDGGANALSDANSQINVAAINQIAQPEYQFNMDLIRNPTWDNEEEEKIKRLRTQVTTPPIYRTMNGWTLGSLK